MSRSTELGIKLALAVVLLLTPACGLGSASGPAAPIRTLSPDQQYLGPTLSGPMEYRPSAAGWIAFVKDNNIWLIHPDGSSAKQVTTNAAPAGPGSTNDLKLAWSVDGQLLAYSQGGVLSVIAIGGLATKQLANNTAGGFDWSATGHQILYDTALTTGSSGTVSNDGLMVISADDGSTRALITGASMPAAMIEPRWSFDAQSVIFSAPEGTGLYLLDASTDKVSDLLGGRVGQAGCSWSPVELLIACIDDHPPEGQAASVVILDQTGKEQKRIPLPAGHAHPHLGPWSSDGGSLTISYSSGPEGFQETTDIVSLDTGEFQTLGPGRASSWSPDGRWIVTEDLSGSNAQAAHPIKIINTTSGLTSTLAEGSSALWQPAETDLLSSAATAIPRGQTFCLNSSVGFVHIKPKGHYLQFCIGSKKYNYGALAQGVYLIGPQAKYFIYVSNSGYVFAARLGDPTLTRIGNVRTFKAVHIPDIDPIFDIRYITGYPNLIQIIEKRYNQKATFTLPRRVTAP